MVALERECEEELYRPTSCLLPYRTERANPLDFQAEVRVNVAPSSQGAGSLSTTLSETELAVRWGMSPKTLQRWRTTKQGPEYLKLGKKVQYSMAVIEQYENQARTNVAFEGADEILLYLRQTGQATLCQIQAACLGGQKSSSRIQNQLYRLANSTPPKIKARLVPLDPTSPVMTAVYSLYTTDEQ